MVTRNVCLVGGPPWGLRFATAVDGRIRITQVLPNGRADREGIRIGDIVETVNGQQCNGYRMLHGKIRSARGVLRFRLLRSSVLADDKQCSKQLPPVPAKPIFVRGNAAELKFGDSKLSLDTNLGTELSTIVERPETIVPLERPLKISISEDSPVVSPKMYRNHLPSGVFPLHSSDFMNVTGYSGGIRGSAHDKKRLFEMLANRKMYRVPTHMDQLFHQKIEYGSPSIHSSDQGTVISGYDSVGGDFAGFAQSSSATDIGRQSPSSSDFAEETYFSLEKPAVPPSVTAAAAAASAIPAVAATALSSGQAFPAPFRLSFSELKPGCNPESDPTSLFEQEIGNQITGISPHNSSSTIQLAHDEQNKVSETAAFTNEQKPAQSLDDDGTKDLANKMQFLQSNFEEPSENVDSELKEMIGTVPPSTPLPLAPPPPPPPPPPPSGGQQAKLKNGFSSGEMKWKMRTETRNGSSRDRMMLKAEGSIEIPEHQSVASLRKQIASKLEVKMPSAAPPNVCSGDSVGADNSSSTLPLKAPPFDEQYSGVPQRDGIVSSTLQNLVPSTSTPCSTPNLAQKTVLPKQQSVVHEPVQRHMSCITPVPFNRTAVLASSATLPPNLLNTYSNNTSPAPIFYRSATFSPSTTTYEYVGSNDYTTSVPYHVKRSTQSMDYQKLGPVKCLADDRQIPQLSTATMPNATSISSIRNGIVSEQAQSTLNQQPPVYVNGYSKNERISKKPDKPTSVSHNNQNDNVPAVNGRINVVHDKEAQFGASSSSVVTTSLPTTEMPPFSKPVELRNEMRLLSDPISQLQPEQPLQTTLTKINYSHMSAPERELKCSSATMPHTENSNWYRNMFKKMHIVDQPDHSVLRYQKREITSPVSTVQRITRAWTPNPRRDNQVDSLRNYELQSRRSKSVGRYVEPHNGMQRRQQHSEYASRWQEEKEPGWRTELGKSAPNGQLSDSAAELKRLAKEEVLTRQKVEKLSEELQQQRNRRHGYVPSASPALQKNFDRFSGLINEFGRSERSTTPRAVSPSEVITCTALYSFKALSPKELSFNRGDVIRVHRIIDVNWMQGERCGEIGIFPSSYVQFDNNKMNDQIKLVALYPFFARNKNELSLKKGETLRFVRNIDANWVEGKNSHGQTGIFPKSYIREAHEADLRISGETTIMPDRPKTPRISSTSFREENPTASVRTNHGNEVEEWQRRHSQEGLSGPAHVVPKNAETYRALYAYQPKNADELELQENDIVFVVEKCDDGWFIGTLLRTGQFGTFPGNYVEKH